MRYIDADALIKKMFPLGIGDGMYTINAKAVKFAIDKTPTADVVPKSEGEWIWAESGQEDYEQYWLCSCCHEKDYFEDKYCPNCGAKMKGGAE